MPARVYMTVSRSGQMVRPRCSKSSPVLTRTASFSPRSCAKPSASFAPPTPPASARIIGPSSAEEIERRWAKQLARLARPPCIRKAPQMDDRPAFGRLSHEQGCRRRELVRGADLGHPQRAPGPVRSAPQVDQGRKPGDADRRADRAKPPGATEAVVDDDAELRAGNRAEALTQALGARVGIFGQQQHRL